MSASASKKVIIAALIGNSLISITKFIAAFITGSSAMVSEGIHSLVDTGNQILLLLGMKRAQRPADARFPFGHGKEIYFWSFVVAIMIFAVGAGISIYEGIHHILQPSPMSDPTVNYIVLGLAMVFEGAAWYFAFREFKAAKGEWGYFEAVKYGKDPTMFVVLFEDSAAMLGLMVAFIGIALAQYTDNPVYDGLASVTIGLILGATAIWLARETMGLLIGESANQHVVKDIRGIIETYPAVSAINELLTMHMGPEYVLVTVSVDFVDNRPSGEIEQVIADIDQAIKAQHPVVKRVFISAQAWSALSSSYQSPEPQA